MKGQLLRRYFEQHDTVSVHLPDLNAAPLQVIEQLSELVKSLSQVVLVGSSLGGFYATQLSARYGLPAVLINPAMRPWVLFRQLFGQDQLPLKVSEQWTLDEAQLNQLEQMAVPFVQDADKILLLLQQGDEVLDYREAERYYTDGHHRALVMCERHGNHAMDDFAAKIPTVYQFLTDSLKK